MKKREWSCLRGMRWILLMLAVMGVAAALCSCRENTEGEDEEAKKVKLSVLLQTEDYQNQSVWKGENADELYRETGILLSLTSADISGDKQLEQYMMTGSLPDIMIFKGVNQCKVLMDAGLLMKWNRHAGQLEKIFEDEAYQRALSDSAQFMGDEEGNVLLMPIPLCEKEHTEDWLPYLRAIPYTGIGSPKADTLEDYLDIVEAMKNKQPYAVTGQRAYGFSLSGEGDVYALEQLSELGYLYGLDLCMVSPLMETSPEKGTTVSIFREDGFYKKALHFYFEANRRGLLDPDSRTQTKKSLQEKYESGAVMFGVRGALTKLYWSEISGSAQGGSRGDAYIPVLAEDMKIYGMGESELEGNWYIAVNELSPNKEKVCEFLNWLYDRESGNRFFCGSAGNILSTKAEVSEEHPWKRVLEEAGVQEELETRIVYDDNEVNRASPASAELREKMRNIGRVNCQLSWDMIYADSETEFEALWEKLCSEVCELGMDEVESFYQRAYEKSLRNGD